MRYIYNIEPLPPQPMPRENTPPIAQYLGQLWDHAAHLAQVHQHTLVVGKCQLKQGHGYVPGSTPLAIQPNDSRGCRQATRQVLLTTGYRVQHGDLELARAKQIYARSVSRDESTLAGGRAAGFGEGPRGQWGSPSPPPSQAKNNNAN